MRLAKDEMFLQKYDPIFQDQINAGMIEEVNTEGLVGNVTYLPHKEVIKNESITIKVRIVFDASAKLKHEVSLNDILCVCVCVCVCLYFFTVKASSVCKMSKTYLRVRINHLVL